MKDEELYLVAYKDIEQKEIDQALWLKAMAHADGNKNKAKWEYVELRVNQMLADPSLRYAASKTIPMPTHQSGAFMMWFSIIFCFVVISLGILMDFSAFPELSFVFSKGLYFLDLPSLLFTLTPAIFFGVATTSWRTYFRCWSYPLGSAKQVSISDATSVARCLKVMGDTAFLLGIIGSLIGVVLILNNFDASKKIMEAASVISLTLFYGIFFKMLSFTAEQRVRNLYLT